MSDIINAYLAEHKRIDRLPGLPGTLRRKTPRVECVDGLTMSVQVGENMYCSPRINDADNYTAVEVGFPSAVVPEFMDYADDPLHPTETVYGWVPVAVVNAVIAAHGGLKGA